MPPERCIILSAVCMSSAGMGSTWGSIKRIGRMSTSCSGCSAVELPLRAGIIAPMSSRASSLADVRILWAEN
jgi:hypothetical protein